MWYYSAIVRARNRITPTTTVRTLKRISRCPNGVYLAAGVPLWPTVAFRVSVVAVATGGWFKPVVFRAYALRHRAYVLTYGKRLLYAAGELSRSEEGITWCRGWKGKAVNALLAATALSS